MSAKKRFYLGGLGALMPVLVSLLAVDIGAMLDQGGDLTTGNIVGFIVRYLVLFSIGGFVAYLHSDENKPIKLFELGIAAPALLTSLITAQGLSAHEPATEPSVSWNFSIIRSAHAAEDQEKMAQPVMLASSFLDDVFKGASGMVYRKIKIPAQNRNRDEPAQAAGEAPPVSIPEPEPVQVPRQSKQIINVKPQQLVAPQVGIATAPRLSLKKPVQVESSNNPAARQVEVLRRKTDILRTQLRQAEQKLRIAERTLSRSRGAD